MDNLIMKDSKPKLPEKLPIEARKKLSVSTINFEDDLAVTTQIPNHSLPKNHEDDENYIYSIYVNPIDQPSMQRSQSALTEESEELKFFNDSIYFKYPDSTSSNETDLDDYSSLALFSSERSRTLVKTTENNVDENSDCKLNSTVHYLIDVANTSPKPPIPPKSNKLSSQLSKLSLTNSYSVENTTKKRNSLEEEMLNYIQPSDKKAYLFDEFQCEIFNKKENRICADCKSNEELPTWVSCVYFMLFCDTCAEIHLKLSHVIKPFYMIELYKLYKILMDSTFFCDVQSFLYMITEQAGNEKINSLLEFKMAQHRNEEFSLEKFIKEKYLNKKYINTIGEPNVDELNRNLANYCVAGSCLPITIYNIFLGASFNCTTKNRRSALDKAMDFNQKYQTIYLRFQGALTYSQIHGKTFIPEEFVGELYQVIDLKNKSLSRSLIILKLCNDNKLLFVYLNKQTLVINLSSIVHVSTMCNDTMLEIKWINNNNTSLSTYLEFFNCFEKQMWLKQLYSKMSCHNFDLEDDTLQINSMAYLKEVKLDGSREKCLMVFLETMESKADRIFKKKIAVIGRESRFYLDARKLVRIRLENNDLIVVDMLPTRSYKFESESDDYQYIFERLKDFIQLKFRSIDEQYLNKDNCPLLIDKLCSFIEIYYLTEKAFYASCNLSENKVRIKSLFVQLETERDFNLTKKTTNINPSSILSLFKLYFAKYLNPEHIDLIKSLKLDFKNFPVLFSIIKRITAHLVLISRYETMNQHSLEYLGNLFTQLMNVHEINFNLDYYLLNYKNVFGLSEDYFKLQANIVDKLIAMKNNKPVVPTETRFSNYLTNIYLERKSSCTFFQISITSTTKPKEILVRAAREFNLVGKMSLSLLEIMDNQFCNLNHEDLSSDCGNFLLERALPINSVLINNCHEWCKFNLVVKKNAFTNVNHLNSAASFHDACSSLSLCASGCLHNLKVNCVQEWHKKWRSSYLSIQNACIRISEREKCAEARNGGSPMNTKKVLFEAKIEECLVYFGLYENNFLKFSESNMLKETSPMSNSAKQKSSLIWKLFQNGQTSNMVVNREQCLTFYHMNDKSIHSVCLDSKQNALNRYISLFKLCHYPDTFSLNF